MQSGQVPIGEILISQFGNEDPMFELDSLPFLATGYDNAWKLYQASKDTLDKRFAARGVRILYSVPWPGQALFSKTPLNTPADFKRLKLRAHSKDLARMFQLLGASPTVIAASEVSTAASRGTIDGLSTSLSSYYARKWFEASPFINNSGFGLIGTVVIINKDLWDKLPGDVKSAMDNASREAEEFSTRSIISEEEALLKDLAQKGVHATAFDNQSAKERVGKWYNEAVKAYRVAHPA